MNKIKVKNYLFAGLDFMFDEKENPWFIEANSAPHAVGEFIDNIDPKILPKLIKMLKKRGKNICYLIDKHRKTDYDNSRWLYNLLSKKMNIHLCYIEDNLSRRKSLISKEKEEIVPDAIFAYYTKIIPRKYFRFFSNQFINPLRVSNVTKDKLRMYELMKSSKIRTPKTFLINNQKDVQNIIKKHEIEHGFVIKPIIGSLGKHIHVFLKDNYLPKIKSKMLMQERVTPPEVEGKFWDVRVFVIDGEYIGCIRRLSEKRVTNISQGGKPTKLPKNFQNKIIAPALKVVKVIDKECEKLSLNQEF